MSEITFAELNLGENLEKAIVEMGFENATDVQAESIPLIRTGVDVIAKSQTGTGKTLAFAIPALETIDTKEDKTTVQVLVLCPTRELAQQAGVEFAKLAKFMPGIRAAEVYGGADMERQFVKLRRANIVIGTPGRVMDHLRRKTLKLDNMKMIVLDEADEMLKMGFKEDIETILLDTPAQRQTVLFSATMPPAILALTKQFQRNPQLIEINKSQVTIDNIDQSFVDVPTGRKNDVLALLLRFHRPTRAIIFCNTKRMVEELMEELRRAGFAAEGLHGDMKQSQRTHVMDGFKRGKITILIATDVAARGIDVSDVDYVINYDLPIKTEYYVHRIGRTGRAGKSGKSITLCSGKRQIYAMRAIAREVKSEIREDSLPTAEDIGAVELERNLATMEKHIQKEPSKNCTEMVRLLIERGYEPERIAATALQLRFADAKSLPTIVSKPRKPEERGAFVKEGRERGAFGKEGRGERTPFTKVGGERKRPDNTLYADVIVSIGSASRVAPNHLVGAITEQSGLSGNQIGKINISEDHSVVGVPADRVDDVIAAMRGCKICGKPTTTMALAERGDGHHTQRHKSETKAAFFAGQRLAKHQSPKGAEPVRRKKKAEPEID